MARCRSPLLHHQHCRVALEERATEAALEYLGDTRMGRRVSPGRARADEERDVEEDPGSNGEKGGPGPP